MTHSKQRTLPKPPAVPALLALLGLLLIAPTLLRAQESPPGAPFVFPAGNGAWTVEIQYHDTPARQKADGHAQPAESRPIKVEIIRVGATRRDRISWSDGKTTETWRADGHVLYEHPDNREVVMLPGDAPVSPGPMDGSIFLWTRDVPPAEKPVNYDGEPCHHYQQTHSPSSSLQAWVNTKTLLPVAWDNGDARYKFTFENAPGAPLALPEKFQKEIARYRDAMQRVPRRASEVQ